MQPDDRSALDRAYRSVRDERRRIVLFALRGEGDRVVSVEELVDEVVERETNSPGPDRDSVLQALYHVHLPLLDEAGAVEFDREDQRVRYVGSPEIEALMDGEIRDLPGLESEE